MPDAVWRYPSHACASEPRMAEPDFCSRVRMLYGGARFLLARPDAARRSLTPIRAPERYGALLASCRAPESRRTIPTSRPLKMPPGAAVGLSARQMRGAVHGSCRCVRTWSETEPKPCPRVRMRRREHECASGGGRGGSCVLFMRPNNRSCLRRKRKTAQNRGADGSVDGITAPCGTVVCAFTSLYMRARKLSRNIVEESRYFGAKFDRPRFFRRARG